MLLAVDVGNTHTVAGLFAGDELADHWRLKSDADATGDELAVTFGQLLALDGRALPEVTQVVVSSVVPGLSQAYREFALRYAGGDAVVVGPGTRTGMRIASDNPHEVGADRIVNAVAAYERFGRSCIVIDMGTATTFDAVSDDGAYLGGAIAPGLGISIAALVRHAALLASVDLVVPERAIGTNTVSSMQSGALLGAISQLEGMLRRFRAELPQGDDVPAVATGGQAGLLAPHVHGLDEFDPLLTLRGLQIVASRQ